ncbi:MAG: single-stranded-DNA-specific exonuclease RecJ [Chloroflexi bacterium]|nr:single-stranded-DNA-specific exonuclease RecJ [Ardenticatenaceae bacterium]MBL1128122.1 single-stranded-DNA-specific exonuclease RecJ [Chloroflexota bacterium]NOG34193.1 single-stranded-DNA-specific exonuclease RecJ [Chloroflexota bacterium]GIK55366.1 MAG: single-stranded-DNA-specific exonuclease RecJ [Chloroflexota bacterium]
MNHPPTIRAPKWHIAPAMPAATRDALGHIHPVLRQVLYNRGITSAAEAQAFLEGRYLGKTDPFLLADMDTAVTRIQRAIENDETIYVYGDFDADGVTATVLLTQALRSLGLSRQQAQPYIPDRVDEGYGLNTEALSKLKENGAGLVISVDCGIRSILEAQHAQSIGLDMIITDHHSLGTDLPPALAVINPKRPDSAYPETMLAGVGIAYKLAQALRQAMPGRAQFEDADLLDLVAIGTVADLAPLLHENRKLVADGLVALNNGRRPGIRALAEVARLKMGSLTAESIAFGIGPRINAAGRLAHAYDAARLLAASNQVDARRYANELNQLNQQRQRLTSELGDRAEAMIDPADPILITADTGYLPGIVGLVASRLAEKHYRPAIVMEQGEEESRGSCRSIDEFHITDALDEVADLLVRHGGHAQAAGFTIRNENLPEFMERMRAIARRELDGRDLAPTLTIDAEIDLADVDWGLFEHLSGLEPTGTANPTPIFASRNVEIIHHRLVGQDGAHLQLQLTSREGAGGYKVLSAIAFRQGAWANHLPQYIDIAYTLNVNEWNGRRDLQLMVQAIRDA